MRSCMQGFSDAFCTVEAAVFLWPGCHLLMHSVSSPNFHVLLLAFSLSPARMVTGTLLLHENSRHSRHMRFLDSNVMGLL